MPFKQHKIIIRGNANNPTIVDLQQNTLQNIIAFDWMSCNDRLIGSIMIIDEWSNGMLSDGTQYFAYLSDRRNHMKPQPREPKTLNRLTVSFLQSINENFLIELIAYEQVN